MRIFLALVIALSACATSSSTGPRPINVALVRHEINDAIHATSKERDVTSMGKVTADHAVVYTTSKGGVRQEENWIKDGSGWKLEKGTALTSTN